MVYTLTDRAHQEAVDFYAKYGTGNCYCFLSPPCGSCVHPGNLVNLDCTPDAWVWKRSLRGTGQGRHRAHWITETKPTTGA